MLDLDTLVLPEHQAILRRVLGAGGHRAATMRQPDLSITPDGKPYLYRWYMLPRREIEANVYLHLQVADDPERPLHDHPWDNQSVILAGGYRELYVPNPTDLVSSADGPRQINCPPSERAVRAGMTVQRRAVEAHRLFLLNEDVPYTISLFSTGPVVREWGFWFDGEWVSHKDVTDTEDGRSTFRRIDQRGA